MNYKIYKLFAIVTVFMLTMLNVNIFATDTMNPVVSISSSTNSVKDGGNITYTVKVADNEGIASFGLAAGKVRLNGFTATQKFNIINATTIEVTLTNIQGTNGAKSVTILSGVAMDYEGNKTQEVTSTSFTLTNTDKVAPVIGITLSANTVKDGGSIKYTVKATDNEEVASFGISADKVKLNGFTATVKCNVVNKTTVEVILSNIQGTDGLKSITVPAGVAVDYEGNKTQEVTSTSFTLSNTDKVAPVIGITLSANAVKDGGSIKYTVKATDNEEVASFGISADKVKLNGFTATVKCNAVNKTTIEVVLTNIQGTDGLKSITVPAGVAVDYEGNKSQEVPTTSFTLTNTDKVAPVLGITLSTNAVKDGGSIKYTVKATDNEEVASFGISADKVKLNGFTATVKCNVVNKTTVEVILSNIQGTDGLKSITIPAGVAVDYEGNKSQELPATSFTLSNTDKLAPVLGTTISASQVVDGGSIKYTVKVADNEAIASFILSNSNVKLNGFTATVKYNVINETTIEVVLTNIQGTDGTKNITILSGAAVDCEGNKTQEVLAPSFTLRNTDKVAPVIGATISASQVVDGGSIKYTVKVADNEAIASFILSNSNVKLNGFTATVKYNAINETTIEVVLTNIQGTDGTKNITILSGAAVDYEGNKTVQLNAASFRLRNTDKVAPVIGATISATQVIDGGSIKYTVKVTDNEAIASFILSNSNIKLNGFTATVKYNVINETTIEVILSNIQGTDGKKNITILSGAAVDYEGNKTQEITAPSFTLRNADKVAPVIGTTLSSNKVNNGGSVKYTVKVTDNEGIASFILSNKNVKLNGFTATVKYNVINETTIEVVLTNIQGTNGDKNITILSGAAVDYEGNKTVQVDTASFTLTNVEEEKDKVAPVIGTTLSPNKVNNGGTVKYIVKVTDNEAIASFILSNSNVKLNGFTATVMYNVIDATTIEVILTNIQGVNGAKNITILSGAAVDFAGNKTAEVTTASFTLTNVEEEKDKVAPVLGTTLSDSKVFDGGSVKYTVKVTDNEGIASFILSNSNVKLNGFTATVKYNVINETTIEVILTNIQGTNGDKNITILAGAAVDYAGNKTAEVTAASFTLTNRDKVRPEISATLNVQSILDGQTVKYIVKASDNEGIANFNLTEESIKLNGFTATITFNVLDNTTIEVILSNVQGMAGKKLITIFAGVAMDYEGNKTQEITAPSFTLVNRDKVKPEIHIEQNVSKVTDGGSITYIVTAIDNIRVTRFELTEKDIVLNGFKAKVTIKNIGNNKYQVTLTNIQGTNGDKNITILAGVALDAEGNKSNAKTSGSFTLRNEDRRAPNIKIDGPDVKEILVNGRVTYIVTVSDDTGIKQFSIKENDVKLNGFTATVIINKLDNTTIQIILLNIKGEVGDKNITIASGVAYDLYGNKTTAINSESFKLVEKPEEKPSTPGSDTEIKEPSCTYLPELSGTLNKELNGFTAWLRSRKDNELNVNKYNFVINGTEITYIIEFYNASSKAEQNMLYTLTIPYNVEVLSTIGGGKIIVKNENCTVIQWNFDEIASGAYGKVEVKVKYLENTELTESKELYEIFYAKLNILNENHNFNSFIQQIYIDANDTKQAHNFGYVKGFENDNMLYVEDEITRLELATLIIESGLVPLNKDTKAYKDIKDYKLLSEEDRIIIGTLMDLGIMEAYADNTFKANNPILMDEIIKIFAKLTEYVSGSKLLTKVSPYIYEDILKDSYGNLVENKYFIMELIRQNIISLEDVNVDKYATRLDAISILNTLTYREETTNNVPENGFEYADVLPEVTYFWDIVTALEDYMYTYNSKLEQVIIKYED